MAFRADESAQSGFERAEREFLNRRSGFDEDHIQRGKQCLQGIVERLGPVVDSYPTWHPLVSHHDIQEHPETTPSSLCGYKGLDHTIFFRNGFITCPYNDGQAVIDSVAALPSHHIASIGAERLDVKLWHPGTTAILVTCEWDKPFSSDGMIPLSIAMPLLLEREIPRWRSSQVAETWETMRNYFLGTPCGSRSSLFVSQDTGQRMKKTWEALINTGMFGPIYV